MKPKILLLHGALGSKKQLDPIKQILEKNYEVLSINFAGHGDDLSTDEYSIALFTQNVIDYLDKNSIESIDIFGYSMGGYIALHAAKNFPERINKIITLGTKFNWSTASAAQEVNMLNPEIIESKVPHFAEKLKAEHMQDWKEVMHKTARLMIGMAEGKKLFDKDFESINHSVTIGIGDADKMVSIEESEKVSKLLKHGDLQILIGVQHPLEKNEPKMLADYIVSGLR